jgi:hypothetical protein
VRILDPSVLLRAGFDRLVLSIPAVSGSTRLTTGFDELRTNGWDRESRNLEGLPDGFSRR